MIGRAGRTGRTGRTLELNTCSPSVQQKLHAYLIDLARDHIFRPKMKKLCPWILLFATATAFANWVKVDGPSGALYEKFIDINAIRQSGPMNTMRRVWEMNNLTNASSSNISSNSVSSVKQHVEYDCKDRRYRLIEESSFSERWAKGESLTVAPANSKPIDWSAIAPGSITETIFNRVCPNG